MGMRRFSFRELSEGEAKTFPGGVIVSWAVCMKRSGGQPPRRSSRARKANQLFSGDAWVSNQPEEEKEKRVPVSPEPTTPPSKPPKVPAKPKKILLFQQKVTRVPSLHSLNSAIPDRVPSPFSLSRPFSFATKSGNAREVIHITDEEDSILSMPADALREKLQCQLCTMKMRSDVLMPCGHFVACTFCAKALAAKGTCPYCRAPIDSSLTVKFS